MRSMMEVVQEKSLRSLSPSFLTTTFAMNQLPDEDAEVWEPLNLHDPPEEIADRIVFYIRG